MVYLTSGAQAPAVPGPGAVILMGLGIVFLGLICIILLITLMSAIVRRFSGKEEAQAAAPKKAEAPAEIPNRGEFVAAVSAAVAEDLGTDISKIRIVSIRRL